MENLPESKNEGSESEEKRIAAIIKSKGLEDQEARDAYIAWCSEQEEASDRAADRALASIEYEHKRALIYFWAGFMEEAVIAFMDAIQIAEGEGRYKLSQKMAEEMDRLKTERDLGQPDS